MNRNRVNDSRPAQAASRLPGQGQADAEVVYVGRASFWTERDSQLFQEMPEAPRRTRPVAQVAPLASRAGAVLSAGVPAPMARVPSTTKRPSMLVAGLKNPRPGPAPNAFRQGGLVASASCSVVVALQIPF